MRISPWLPVALLLLAGACSCQQPPAPTPPATPATPEPATVAPPAAPAQEEPPRATGTHPDEFKGSVTAKPPTGKPIVWSEGAEPVKQEKARAPGELATFHGFSADGKEFAYAAWSEGAGFAILHVISSATSEQVKDFRLEEAPAIKQAEAYLGSKHFLGATLDPPERLGDRKVAVSMDGLTATVKLGDKLLWSGNPFGSAVPAKNRPRAAVVAWSPDGKKVAVRADVVVGAEFGRATGVRIVEVPE